MPATRNVRACDKIGGARFVASVRLSTAATTKRGPPGRLSFAQRFAVRSLANLDSDSQLED